MIITYHRIRNEKKSCNLKAFENQVRFAKRFGFKLTFDDGLLDHYKILPILKKHNATGTFFIITNCQKKMPDTHKIWLLLKTETTSLAKELGISKRKCHPEINYKYDDIQTANLKMALRSQPMLLNKKFKERFNEREEIKKMFMNWKQIKELKENGMEIENHGHTHRDLSRLTLKAIKEEIEKSTQLLTVKVGKPRGFSYPYGRYNYEAIKLLKRYGYKYAVTTLPENEFALKRIDTRDLKT